MKHETGGEILFTMKSESPHEDGVRFEVNVYEERGEPRVEASVVYRAEDGEFRQGVFRMSPRDARNMAALLNDVLDKFEAGEFEF